MFFFVRFDVFRTQTARPRFGSYNQSGQHRRESNASRSRLGSAIARSRGKPPGRVEPPRRKIAGIIARAGRDDVPGVAGGAWFVEEKKEEETSLSPLAKGK